MEVYGVWLALPLEEEASALHQPRLREGRSTQEAWAEGGSMKNTVALIYFVRRADGLVKIGQTINWRGRRSQLSPLKPQFLFGFSIDDHEARHGYGVESAFHVHFRQQRFGHYERFNLSESHLTEAKSLQLYRAQMENYVWSRPFCLCHGWNPDWPPPSEAILQPVLLNRITPKPFSPIPTHLPDIKPSIQ